MQPDRPPETNTSDCRFLDRLLKRPKQINTYGSDAVVENINMSSSGSEFWTNFGIAIQNTEYSQVASADSIANSTSVFCQSNQPAQQDKNTTLSAFIHIPDNPMPKFTFAQSYNTQHNPPPQQQKEEHHHHH